MSRLACLCFCAVLAGTGQSSCTVLRISPPEVTVMIADGNLDNTRHATTTYHHRRGLLSRWLFPDNKDCN
jgi:hypothetical protein